MDIYWIYTTPFSLLFRLFFSPKKIKFIVTMKMKKKRRGGGSHLRWRQEAWKGSSHVCHLNYRPQQEKSVPFIPNRKCLYFTAPAGGRFSPELATQPANEKPSVTQLMGSHYTWNSGFPPIGILFITALQCPLFLYKVPLLCSLRLVYGFLIACMSWVAILLLFPSKPISGKITGCFILKVDITRTRLYKILFWKLSLLEQGYTKMQMWIYTQNTYTQLTPQST